MGVKYKRGFKKIAVAMAIMVAVVFGIGTGAFTAERLTWDSPGHAGETITLLMFPTAGTWGMQYLLPEFEAKTGIKVKIMAMPVSQIHEKAMADFVGKVGAVDIIEVVAQWLYGFAGAGYLQTIDPYIEKAGGWDALKLDDVVPRVLDVYGNYKGSLYCFPAITDVQFLTYRKDLFEKYGVTVPKNYGELIETAKKLTLDTNGDGKIDIFGYTPKGERGDCILCEWQPWAWYYGGQIFREEPVDPDNGYTLYPVCNSPNAIKATEQFVNANLKWHVVPPGIGDYGNDEVTVAMQQGKTAMVVHWIQFAYAMDDPRESKVAGKLGFTGLTPSHLGGWGIGMNNFSKHKEAAFQFMMWMNDPEVEYRLSLRGYIPCRRSTFYNPALVEMYPYYPGVLKALEYSRFRPAQFPEWVRVEDILGAHLTEALVGAMSVKEALDLSAKELKEMLAEVGFDIGPPPKW